MTEFSQLEIRPLTPIIGAEIHGVDLSADLGATLISEIRDAFLNYGVVKLN